jgi:hypothetical protein
MSEPSEDQQQVQIPNQKRKANESELDADMSARSDDEDETPAVPLHPLFMDGLPSDFSSNPALAALASLLEEDGASHDAPSQEKRSSSTTGGSGRKLRRISSQPTSSGRDEASPLTDPSQPVTQPNEATKETTIGEAALFVKLWKL